jgi:hypothetical protein
MKKAEIKFQKNYSLNRIADKKKFLSDIGSA